MRSFLLLTVLAGCGDCGGGHATIDARPPIDTAIDAPDIPVTCTNYCTIMQANCAGANTQYPGANAAAAMQSCVIACSSFQVGSSKATDITGNTLGCRIHFAVAASNTAEAAQDCAIAGPLGDQIKRGTTAFCSGGDICVSFCTIETRACGTMISPLPGNPKDAGNNFLYQYQDVDDCVGSCHMFNLVSPYAVSSRGNSLACRLVQSINASLDINPDAINDCADTGAPPAGLCVGAANP